MCVGSDTAVGCGAGRCGQSASFTLWLRSDSLVPGYMVRAYSHAQGGGRVWAIWQTQGGLEVYGPFSYIYFTFPAEFASLFERQPKSAGLRHIAYVFDSNTNSFRFYLDGTLVGEAARPDTVFAEIDCYERLPDDYFAVFHRQPGAWNFKGVSASLPPTQPRLPPRWVV